MCEAAPKTDVRLECEWTGSVVPLLVIVKPWLDSSWQPPAWLWAVVGGQDTDIKLWFWVQSSRRLRNCWHCQNLFASSFWHLLAAGSACVLAMDPSRWEVSDCSDGRGRGRIAAELWQRQAVGCPAFCFKLYLKMAYKSKSCSVTDILNNGRIPRCRDLNIYVAII